MLHNPSLILLDEPYTGLDAQAVAMLNAVLDEIVASGQNRDSHDARSRTRPSCGDPGDGHGPRKGRF